MARLIASVDAGNGGTNAILWHNGQQFGPIYFPSIRMEVTGDSLGFGNELSIDYVDYKGSRYAVGDDVLLFNNPNITAHRGGENRYGDETQQFLVDTAIAGLGVTAGVVQLILFAPPGVYSEVKDRLAGAFEGREVEIQLKDDSGPRRWRYKDVKVLPEGLGALMAFGFTDEGENAFTTVLDGRNLLLDVGLYTVDAVEILNGQVISENKQEMSFRDDGIFKQVLQPVLRYAKTHGGRDFRDLTAADVDHSLRAGLVGYDRRSMSIEKCRFSVRRANKTLDLTDEFQAAFQRLATWLHSVIDSSFNELAGYSGLFLIGGGADLVREYIRTKYPDRLWDHATIDHIANVEPWDMNIVGGLRYALALQKMG